MHQQAIDTYFQSVSGAWRDVYDRSDLSGLIHRERQSTALAMLKKVQLSQSSRILEVGCGAGLTTVLLAKSGYRVVGIDTVQSMLDLANQQITVAGVRDSVELIQMDAYEMCFPPNEFDLAVAIGVVPWAENPERAIGRMARVVRPGGYLLLTSDNQWCLNHIVDPRCFPGLRVVRWKIADLLQYMDIRPISRPRYQYYSISKVHAMLSLAGLQPIESVTVGFGPFTLFNIRLLSDSTGIKVHEKLQSLARMGVPFVRSAGVECVVLARKL